MRGGADDDTYVVDDAGDDAIESDAAGNDTGGADLVRSSVAFALSFFVEHLTLTGSDDIAGIGNELGNTIVGNAGDNQLEGYAGDDSIDGGAGNDLLSGGRDGDTLAGDYGDDTLYGGPGSDRMSGSAGNDYLVGGAAGPDDTGFDTLAGGDGDGTILNERGAPGRIDAGTGDDLIVVSDNPLGMGGMVDGGAGHDTPAAANLGDAAITGIETLETRGEAVRGTVAQFLGFDRIVTYAQPATQPTRSPSC